MVAATCPESIPNLAEDHCSTHRRSHRAAEFELAVCQHQDRWQAIARRMLGSDHDAADAVQEAYVAALDALDRFRGDSLLSTWIHRIVVTKCLMKLRSRRKDSRNILNECLASTVDDDRIVAHEMRRLVRDCVDRLPEGYRDVVVLRDLDECDTIATARALRLAPGAVKTRLHRARRALRALLEESVDGDQSVLCA